MYSIGHVADQVGITTATLRAWERRYSVVRPQRTDGDYRIYSEDDLKVLQAMKQLVDSGWSPSFAAREAQRRQESGPAEPTLDGAELTEQFVAAAAALDAERLDEILDRMFALASFEVAIGTYVSPAMRALGDAWESGQASVAGEHLASHAVGRRLAAIYEATARTHSGRRVLIGLGPGSRHELGLLAFAVAARRRGLAADYLGSDVPVEDWVSASSDPTVAAAVLALPTADEVQATAEVIEALRRHRPDLVIAAGGPEEGRAPDGVNRLGADLFDAVHVLADIVASPESARG